MTAVVCAVANLSILRTWGYLPMRGKLRRLCLCLMLSGCAAPRGTADPPGVAADVERPAEQAGAEEFAPAAEAPLRQVAHQQPAPPVDASPAAPDDSGPFRGPATVDELVQFAVTHNPEISAARARARALGHRVPQLRALDDPMLVTTAFLEEVQTAAGPQEVMLGISQKFPWFGKRAIRSEAAWHEARAAYAELAAVQLHVVEQVKLAYYELYFLDGAIEVNRSLEPKLKDVAGIARSKYETNAKNVGLESVLQAEVGLARLQATLVELEQARRRQRARLIETLHLPQGATLEIKPIVQPAVLPQDGELLAAMIEQCHPQLQAARHRIGRDQQNIDLARRNYYPDVTLGFNWIGIGGQGLSPVATGDDAYALAVGANLPIYRQRLDAAVREAQSRQRESSGHYAATLDQLRADVAMLHAEAIEHDRVLGILQREILPKALQTFNLSIEAYRLDRITFPQLIDNYEALLRYRIDDYQHRSKREQSLARLERAVGCAVTGWMQEPADLAPAPAP